MTKNKEIRKELERIRTIAEEDNPGCKSDASFPSGDTLITLPNEFTIKYGHECTLTYNAYARKIIATSKANIDFLGEYKDYCRVS